MKITLFQPGLCVKFLIIDLINLNTIISILQSSLKVRDVHMKKNYVVDD